MDNQQERLEKDWCWLGGIIDGEGSINILCSKRKPKWVLTPQCRLTNTCDVIIDEARRILSEAEIPHHVMSVEPNSGSRAIRHISISGAKRSKRFLLAIRPYLRSKRHQADIVLNWIDRRLSKPMNTPYDQQEIEWYGDLRKVHGKRTPVSSETICQELSRQMRASQDIVRPAAKSAERSRNVCAAQA